MDVKTLCLGVLSQGDHSGYEIRKAFEDGFFSHFQEAGFGSIYPALKRLTEEGLVLCREQEQDNRPDKKVYRITPKGRQALFEAINQPPAEDKFRSDFAFVMFFADLLEPRDVDRLLQNRIAYHRDKLAMLADKVGQGPGDEFMLGYGRAIHQAALQFLENHQHELLGSVLQADVAE
jgi:DNA-binding PadR family transcriptional regulator